MMSNSGVRNTLVKASLHGSDYKLEMTLFPMISKTATTKTSGENKPQTTLNASEKSRQLPLLWNVANAKNLTVLYDGYAINIQNQSKLSKPLHNSVLHV